MSLDDFMPALVDAIADAVAERLAKRTPSNHAKALTRREAEKALGVGRSKLQDMIANGEIHTVKDDPRRIPMSEVERCTQPRRQKPRRAPKPKVLPQGGVADGNTTRDRLADLIRQGKR